MSTSTRFMTWIMLKEKHFVTMTRNIERIVRFKEGIGSKLILSKTHLKLLSRLSSNIERIVRFKEGIGCKLIQ